MKTNQSVRWPCNQDTCPHLGHSQHGVGGECQACGFISTKKYVKRTLREERAYLAGKGDGTREAYAESAKALKIAGDLNAELLNALKAVLNSLDLARANGYEFVGTARVEKFARGIIAKAGGN